MGSISRKAKRGKKKDEKATSQNILTTQSPDSIPEGAMFQPKDGGAPIDAGRAMLEAKLFQLMSQVSELVRLRQFDKAEQIISRVLEVSPDNFQAHSTRANMYFNLANYEHAIGAYEKSLEVLEKTPGLFVRPNTKTDIINNLALCYSKRRQYVKAAELYRKAIELSDSNKDILISNLSGVMLKMGELKESVSILHEALKEFPDSVPINYTISSRYYLANDKEKAIEFAEKVLSIEPDHADSLHIIAESKKYDSPDHPEVETMKEMLTRDYLSLQDARVICFSLGTIYHSCKMYDEAFSYYRRGNEAHRQIFGYDEQGSKQNFIQHVQTFNKSTIDFVNKGSDSEMPVFVVGMPRSGTTLTEQIIAAHPKAHDAGELPHIHSLFLEIQAALQTKHGGKTQITLNDYKDFMTEQRTQDTANRYLELALEYCDERSEIERFVDKMPANFLCIGFIRTLFPKARIIHTMRNPLDNILSCYFQNFTVSNDFAFNLADAARYYVWYRDIMTHWRNNGVEMLEVQYEDLVQNPEDNMRKLIAHTGLEWDDSCLEFYKGGRTIRTASAGQVHQPIYTKSVERWRPYKQHLQPAIDVLLKNKILTPEDVA